LSTSEESRLTVIVMTTVGFSDQVGRNDVLNRYFLTIRLQKTEELKELIDSDQTIVDGISRDGFNGLQLACKYGFVDVADLLLSKNVSVFFVDAKHKRTGLHWAAINGHSSIVSSFLADHRDMCTSILDITDASGHSALTHAVKGGRVEVVRLLLSADARLDITLGSGASAKTVFDLCNKSTELLAMLKQAQSSDHTILSAAPQAPTLTPAPASNAPSRKEFEWGLSTSTHTTAHSQTRKKCIEFGWIKRSRYLSPTSGACMCSMAQVVVKLNRDDRELLAEIANRSLLNTPVTIVAPAATTTTTTTAINTAISSVVASAVPSTSDPVDSNPHFVQCLHPTTITHTNKGGVWHGIVLEKGLLDLHHLYDYMHQHTTYARLRDLRWKLDIVTKICDVCIEMTTRGLVWYDLKPSNFIVFPVEKARMDVRDIKKHNMQVREWLQSSTWDSGTFTLKAADLSSLYCEGNSVEKALVSCTAKYLHPEVAVTMSDKGSTNIFASSTHMRWSFAMSVLQLLHTENKPMYAHFHITTSEQVYAFLTQDVAVVQSKVNEYVAWLVQHHCGSANDAVCSALCTLLTDLLDLSGNVRFEAVNAELMRIMSLIGM